MAYEELLHQDSNPEKATPQQAQALRVAINALAVKGKESTDEHTAHQWIFWGTVAPDKAPDVLMTHLPALAPDARIIECTITAGGYNLPADQPHPVEELPESFMLKRGLLEGGVRKTHSIEYELKTPSEENPSGISRRLKVSVTPLIPDGLLDLDLTLELEEEDLERLEDQSIAALALDDQQMVYKPTPLEQALDNELTGVTLLEASQLISFIRQCTSSIDPQGRQV